MSIIDNLVGFFSKNPVYTILLIEPETQSTQVVDLVGVKDLIGKVSELLGCETLGRLNLDCDNFLFFDADDDSNKQFGYYMEGSFGMFRDIRYGKGAIIHVGAPYQSTTWDDSVFRSWFQWAENE